MRRRMLKTGTKARGHEGTKGNAACRSSTSCLRASVPPCLRSAGFTLVEIMLAVLLVSLLASAAALSFQKPIRAARAQDAVELVRSFDASEATTMRSRAPSRPAARRTGSTRGTWLT